MMSFAFSRLALAFAVGLMSFKAAAQPASGPPAVGVVRAERQQITQSDEFIGRIQAVSRVALVARVTAFIEKRLFVEGTEVHKGDLLYQLEQPPFQAQVDASKATVDQLEAQHRNAQQTLDRAQELLNRSAGPQSNLDSAVAAERALAAQIAGAKAQLETAADQSRLHRDSRAHRRPDQQHRDHRRQRRLADQRVPWRRLSARTRCMCSFRFPSAPGSICATATPTRAGSRRSSSSCACPTAEFIGRTASSTTFPRRWPKTPTRLPSGESSQIRCSPA